MASKETTQSTLIRGLAILEKVVHAERPLSSAYIAEDLDVPKPTAHRIAQQLEEEGFLQRAEGGKRFTAGKRLRDLARTTLTSSTLNAHRHLILQTLSDEVEETCNLVMLDGTEIIYLDRVETNWPYRIHLPIGSRLPMHCTATGQLFLAHMKSTQRTKLLSAQPLKTHTPRTITNLDKLEARFQEILARGIGFDTGEFLEEMIAIAVPVYDPEDNLCYSIAIHAPASRRTLEELEQYLPALQVAAEQLSKAEWD